MSTTEAATSAMVDETMKAFGKSSFVSLGSIGRSVEGREIPIAVVANPPVEFDQSGPVGGAEALGDRMVVLLFGSIHAGELCGTNALMRLVHGLLAPLRNGREIDWVLGELVICVVPIYNVDGYADFGPDHRPGQNGPALMGRRANAQGLDLNRDWLKMDAPETRAMVGFLNAWDPSVIVDTHTTNGSNHRFTLTYQGPKHPAGDPAVIAYVRDAMLPRIDERFEASTGYISYFYGNFAEHHTKWTTYPAEPWYGAAYRGIRNRLTVLTEAYAYASFEDRVLSTQAFCEEILRDAATHKREIRTIIDSADAAEIERGRRRAPIAVKTEARAFAEPATIAGYEEPVESGAHSERLKIDFATTPHKDYEIPIFNDWVPTELVRRPTAYVIPESRAEVIDRLRAHGIELATFREETTVSIDAEVYTVTGVERAEREWQNRTMMTFEVDAAEGSVRIETGCRIVRTDQPLGALAAYMLEPRSTGGLAAWGFFEDLEVGDPWPVARIDDAAWARLFPED